MAERIYIIGHRNPDTDSICSAIAYAEFKKETETEKEGEYIPARIGDINSETAYVLDRFGFKEPILLDNGAGKKLILVDHNEESQSIENCSMGEIVEVIDHHKINFKYPKPIFYHSEPIGSTATIIADKFLSCGKKIKKDIGGILLSAILSDTVVFKSPTTTKKDIEIANKLAKIAEIDNIKEFGIAVKKAKSSLSGLSVLDIIYSDFKDFDFNGKRVGIGQIEIVDKKEYEERKEELLMELKNIQKEKDYALLILMITNIMEEGSELLVVGMTDKVEKAFGKKVKNNRVYLKGVMSRKKEIVPPLEGIF
ncbi:MAG: manganese-dependent inorganic pyrophosphatase [Candidatus Altiarchaeales archaeon]|nr:MAG: manganese-dependent inorganic pyrophosphatase [Candidatus Altiarchaeales archaeon]